MSPPTLIREAVATDARLLGPLFRAWDHPQSEAALVAIVAEWANTPRASILVAETDDGRLAGMAAVVARPGLSSALPIAHLSGLVVAPNQRRTGLGAALLDAAEQLTREWGCSRIELSSSLGRDAAHHFYPAQGYEDGTVHHGFYQKCLG